MRRITLGIVVFVSLFFMLAPAQAGTVSLSPSLGPPGTTIIIGYSGSLPATNYTCNIDGGADMGWIPQTNTFSYNVPMGTPTGTLIYVNCRQEWVDEPDASTAVFTVTAPDSDGDGMPDDIDQCPNLFGQTQTGCPDSDGDGVTDNVDQCPNEAGTLPNGCLPDSDGDTVPDVRDACLYEYGTLPNGCPPDSDGDGIGDYRDDCPYEFAQTQNGCPAQPTQPTSTPRPTVAPVTQPEQPVIVPTEEATP
ncbi:MAG: thrombospondin type 3 repeat-containing protein, partial [Anaerolineae bacterium]|nr:thrombospondin type 3 repeat-containing protein [Anaerolineae bacterium]